MRENGGSRRGTRLAAGLIALVACGEVGDDPVAATRRFLSAVKRGDCDVAWTSFSQGTRENAVALVKKQVREAPYPMQQRPEDLYCEGTYGDAKPRTARLVTATGETAVVSVLFAEGTHFPIIPFLSTPYREWWSELQLVRKAGRWKVERPRVEVGRPGWDLIEVGDIEVSYSRTGNPRRRWVQARAIVRAPRESLEATLMDALAWSRMLPMVTHVHALDGADQTPERRLLLRFEAPDGAAAEVPVVIEPYGHLRDPKLPWTKIQWVVAKDARPSTTDVSRPAIYTGSWELQTRYDGFWVTFGVVIQPDEWPPSLADALLASDNVAGAITALERDAARNTVAAK